MLSESCLVLNVIISVYVYYFVDLCKLSVIRVLINESAYVFTTTVAGALSVHVYSVLSFVRKELLFCVSTVCGTVTLNQDLNV